MLDAATTPVLTTQGPTTEEATTAEPTTTTTAVPIDYQRTVVFIQLTTNLNEFVFARGGIFPTVEPECAGDADATSQCAIPIQVTGPAPFSTLFFDE